MTTKLKYLKQYFQSFYDGSFIEFFKKPIAIDLNTKSLHYKISTNNPLNNGSETLVKNNIRDLSGTISIVDNLYSNGIAPIVSLPYLKQIDVIPVDVDAQAYFTKVSSLGAPITEPYRTAVINTITYWKGINKWNNLTCLFIDNTGNETWAKTCLKDPNRQQTPQNTYIGQWTANNGWVGNADFTLLSGVNLGDGGTYPSTQNNMSVHLCLKNNIIPVGSFTHEISSFDTGYSQGTLINAGYPIQSRVNSGGESPLNANLIASNKGWMSCIRSGPSTENVIVAGLRVQQHVQSSTPIENKQIGRMGAYNGTFLGVANFRSTNVQMSLAIGDSTVTQDMVRTACNIYGATVSSSSLLIFNKRVINEGDSMTGSANGTDYSSEGEHTKAMHNALPMGWMAVAHSTNNRTMANAVSFAATELDVVRNTSLAKDIININLGTNDLATGSSAATLLADYVTFGTARKALGFKVVFGGIFDRKGSSFSGGATLNSFNTQRALVRTQMLADFNVPTAVPGVWLAGPGGSAYGDMYIDYYSNANFADASNSTYFMSSDQVHGTRILHTQQGTDFEAPAMLLL